MTNQSKHNELIQLIQRLETENQELRTDLAKCTNDELRRRRIQYLIEHNRRFIEICQRGLDEPGNERQRRKELKQLTRWLEKQLAKVPE